MQICDALIYVYVKSYFVICSVNEGFSFSSFDVYICVERLVSFMFHCPEK